jgi:ribonuclease VapC
MNKSIVLDASAVLAILHKESGSEMVAERLRDGGELSAVNLAEVISKQQEFSIPPHHTVQLLPLLGIQVHEFDTDSAILAGSLRTVTKHLGLSLGDRACLALAKRLKLPVLTADRIWTQLDLGIEVIPIR